MSLPVINSHNGWSPLEECWLGDVYPASWYEHLEPQVRDVFQQITEITQQDLRAIENTLKSHNVVVQRPSYHRIEDHVQDNGMLIKPDIMPRDSYVVVGNTLYSTHHTAPQWDHVLDQYRRDARVSVQPVPAEFINGANVVRVGRDIVIDTCDTDMTYTNWWPDYRVQLEKNGGHLDGCFAILKPGLILANHYYNNYQRTFPDWEIIHLNRPTYWQRRRPHTVPGRCDKFFDSTVGTNQQFNDHVIKHALDWVGVYTETYFELNCLSINESTVIMLADNEPLAEELSRHGITVHWVPFRTQTFWDGGMHCLTVDIRRQSTAEDFFPQRG